MEIRKEYWYNYEIRFVNLDGEWYAVLKDICDALGLRTDKVAQRLSPDMLERVRIDVCDHLSRGVTYENEKGNHLSRGVTSRNEKGNHISTGVTYENEKGDMVSNGVTFGNGVRHTRDMLVVNEYGVYEALFASRKLEARKFRLWSANVMKKLREKIGLEGYEVMKMTDPEYQDRIDFILDSLYYDEETGMVMQSVTIQGGDVDQIPFAFN